MPRLALPDPISPERLHPTLAAPREILETEDAGAISVYTSEPLDTMHDAPPVLLLHTVNAAASSYQMQPLFEALRRTRRVFAPDLPGYGLSECSNRRYLPDLYVDAISDVLARIDQPTDIVAFSLSAEFAALVALRHPDRVRSLALISPTGMNAAENQVQRINREGISPRMHHALSNPLWRDLLFGILRTRPVIRHFLRQQLERAVDPDLLQNAWATTRVPGARYAPFYFLSGAMFSPDILRHVYVKLVQPVMVLYDRSPAASFDALPEICRRRENWRAVRVAPSRGLVQWDQPEECVRALEAFWSDLVPTLAER